MRRRRRRERSAAHRNGDVYTYEDYNAQVADSKLATCMIGRGAIIKPWLMTEIKEQRHWDISASERLEFFKTFCRYGLEHWGSDSMGAEKTLTVLLGVDELHASIRPDRSSRAKRSFEIAFETDAIHRAIRSRNEIS